ncbi:MAG: cellulase family glycosylhydrolase [Spirochaetales bacterium]|nr:cellulase family glycosylhydrolase [Spirochaetales bacterium]
MKTEGTNFIDANGKPFFIRAIGLGNWLLPEGYMWGFRGNGDRPRKIEKVIENLIGEKDAADFWIKFRKNYMRESDVKRIKEVGFNTVRVPINWRILMTEDDAADFKEEGFKLLADLTKWCKKHKVYIVWDLHGAPGGQTGTNIDDSEFDKPELFMYEKNMAKTVKLWKEIARRYVNEPIVIAYDLLNEPLPQGKFSKYKKHLLPLYKRITAAIREIDKNHMITIEGANWANDWSMFREPFDSNLFYQFHKYWNDPTLGSIQSYISKGKTYNVPIWLGETGENDNSWYKKTFKMLEDNNVSWAFWPWKKIDATNNPYSVKKPKGWYRIVSHVNSGYKIDKDGAQPIFDELIEYIKIENCIYNKEVIEAIIIKK